MSLASHSREIHRIDCSYGSVHWHLSSNHNPDMIVCGHWAVAPPSTCSSHKRLSELSFYLWSISARIPRLATEACASLRRQKTQALGGWKVWKHHQSRTLFAQWRWSDLPWSPASRWGPALPSRLFPPAWPMQRAVSSLVSATAHTGRWHFTFGPLVPLIPRLPAFPLLPFKRSRLLFLNGTVERRQILSKDVEKQEHAENTIEKNSFICPSAGKIKTLGAAAHNK